MQFEPRPLARPAAHALLHLTVFIWGFTAILGRLIEVSALSLVFYRLWIVVGILLLWHLIRRPADVLPRRDRTALLGIGVLVGCHWITFYACVKHSGITVSVLLLSAQTVITALCEPWIFRRPIRLYEVVLGLVVILGMLALLRVEGTFSAVGTALGLSAGVFGAVFGTLNGRVARSMPARAVMFWELLGAAIVTTCAIGLIPASFVAPSQLASRDVILLVVFAVGCTIIPWLWSLRVLTVLSPYTVSLAVALEPLYAMSVAAIIWPHAESLSVGFYLGAAVLIAVGPFNAFLQRRLAPPVPASALPPTAA